MPEPAGDKGKKKESEPDLDERILQSVNKRRGHKTDEWLASLAKEALQSAKSAVGLGGKTGTAPAGGSTQTTTAWLDHLFDCFARYAFDLNEETQRPDILIQVERPAPAKIELRDRRPPETFQILKGRVFTRDWTVLISGLGENVEMFLLPTDKVIAFLGGPDQFTCFAKMKIEHHNREGMWWVGGQALSREQVSQLARELIEGLIKITRGEASLDDAFSFGGKAEEEPAGVPARPMSTGEFDLLTITGPRAKKLDKADTKKVTMSEACDLLSQAISDELEELAEILSKPSADGDSISPVVIEKRTAKLSALREEMLKTVELWKDAINAW